MFHDHGYRSFVAAAFIPANKLVKIVGDNQVNVCGIADDPIGVSTQNAASGDPCNVKLINSDGTFEILCASTATGLVAGANVGCTNVAGELGVAANGATKLLFQLIRAGQASRVSEVALK